MREIKDKYFINNNQIKNSVDFNINEVSGTTSVYEVIRIIDGQPLFLKDHHERMLNSIKLSNLQLDILLNELIDHIKLLIKANNLINGNCKILVNKSLKSSKEIYCYSIKYNYPSVKEYQEGVITSIFKGIRENPNVKKVLLNFRNLVDSHIEKMNVYEAILIDNNSNITEGSRSNIFFIKDGCIYTPPQSVVLPGITRKYVFKICNNLKIPVIEKNISISTISEYESIFLSGTSPKVLPVKEIDVHNFSVNNLLLKQIMDSYDNEIITYFLRLAF